MLAPSTRAALDLYLIDDRALASVGLADAVNIAHAVVEALDACDEQATDHATNQPVSSWLTAPTGQQRRFVWLAVGMVMNEFRTSATNALALLRSYAYGHRTELDELASALVAGQLTLKELHG